MQGQAKAVVVGAGPAGCVAAAALAKRGFKVEVYERRAEPVPSVSFSPKAYVMLLNSRSEKALQDAGLQLSLVGPERHMQGLYFNSKPSSFRSNDQLPQYIVDRGLLACELVRAVKQAAGADNITWHWGAKLTDVDWEKRTATFEQTLEKEGDSSSSEHEDAGGTTALERAELSTQYDLLVGADGASSAVREALQQAVPGFHIDNTYNSKKTYKAVHGLDPAQLTGAAAELMPALTLNQPRRAIYMFRKQPHPNNVLFWTASNGSISCFFAVAESYKEADVRQQLRDIIPVLPAPWVEQIVAQVKEGGPLEPNSLGRIIRVSQFHGPRCVLLGDAAHAISSLLGQGCNFTLDTVRCFMHTLDAVGGDLDKLPAAFTAARIKDAHAMQRLEFNQNVFAYPKGVDMNPLGKAGIRLYVLVNMVAGVLAHKLLPSVFKSPFRLSGLADWRVSYSDMLNSMHVVAACTLAVAVAALGPAAQAAFGSLMAATAAM